MAQTAATIRAQGLPDVQRIIADGGSTDGTLEVIEANRDLVGHWFAERDHGIYDAWNGASPHVRGDWVLFLGASGLLLNEHSLSRAADALACVPDTTLLVSRSTTPVRMPCAGVKRFSRFMSNLTISIVSHGHGALLAQLLTDLDACPSLSEAHVIVTLNLPGERIPETAYERIQVISMTNPAPKGFGANHNAAFRLCQTRWFAVLNPDLRLRSDPFPMLLQHASNLPRPGVLAPRIVNSQGRSEDSARRQPTPWSVAARVISRRFGRAEQGIGTDASGSAFYWLAGMFLLFNAEAYRSIGGFDERFFLYYEDYDICARLHRAGHAVAQVPAAKAVHDGQRTSRKSARYLKWHVMSLLRVWTSGAFWSTWCARPSPGKMPSSMMTTPNVPRRLVVVELNEVNFSVAQKYAERLELNSFRTICSGDLRQTSSESRYEELEPWIQWVSAHSGLTASEHGIFRLGDIVGTRVPQMYEQLEARGLRVGAVSPMNTENRLSRPAYFLPDPWTKTPSDGSFWSRRLTQAISQAVNDNSASRITAASAATLLAGLARFARPRHYGLYARLAASSRRAPWRKALFLDLFLHDVHWRLMRRHQPHFTSLFLNAGAHIQHHYFLNSKVAARPELRNPTWYVGADADPIAEMLQVYDVILGEYLADESTDLIVATGLSQQPYDRVKFYYRLKDHAKFLQRLGLRHKRVVPRMTRDFLIEFDSREDAQAGAQQLAALKMVADGIPLFAEIDNRGDSVFATLTYPHEIQADSVASGAGFPLPMPEHVVFVAIKNGMHASQGYIWCRGEVARHAPPEGAHVKALHGAVMQHFGMIAAAERV